MTILHRIFSILLPKTRLSKSLRILVTVNAAIVFVLGMFAPFYAIFVVKIGGDIALAGFSWAFFMITAGILMMLFSKWEVRIKEQELLLSFGYFLMSGAFLSFAFMDSIPQLILTQALLGISVAITTPVMDSLYSAHTIKKGLVMQWGARDGILAVTSGIAALIAGILIEGLGYNTIFILMAAITAFLGIYVWRLPREVL